MLQEEFIELLKHMASTTVKDISHVSFGRPFRAEKPRGGGLRVLGSRAPMKPELRRGGLLHFAAPRRNVCDESSLNIRTHRCPFDSDSDPDSYDIHAGSG
jgi:hypothetical protein